MSRLIGEISVQELLPESIRHDETIKAAAAALDAGTAEILAAIRRLSFWEYLDDLSGPILSHLAARLHVDLWDPAWSDEIKRQAIRDSIVLHKYKGTPWAVERAVEAVLGGDCLVEEWWQYGGAPYMFRVTAGALAQDAETYELLFRLVAAAKNARSWLDVLRVNRDRDAAVYHAAGQMASRTVDIWPSLAPGLRNSSVRAGGAVYASRETTIALDPNIDSFIPESFVFIGSGLQAVRVSTITMHEE